MTRIATYLVYMAGTLATWLQTYSITNQLLTQSRQCYGLVVLVSLTRMLGGKRYGDQPAGVD
jgi:hypothetical protein